MAANASDQGNSAAGPPTGSVQAAPNSIQQTHMANLAVANNKATTKTAIPPTPSPAPVPNPPNAQPQMPPSPEPIIALNRAPQPESEPDLSQGPAKAHDNGGWRRENDTGINNSNRSPNGDLDRDSDRDDDNYSNRRRNNDTFNRRRPPEGPNRNDSDRGDRDDDDENYPGRNKPELIQWTGRVNNEREIKIMSPGVPGTVDIPRQFRDRVGIVEPPSANNSWSCAVLRVFGRGGVSFVIRFGRRLAKP